jgi:hypothetical protein
MRKPVNPENLKSNFQKTVEPLKPVKTRNFLSPLKLSNWNIFLKAIVFQVATKYYRQRI